jgi:CheY-like chemotaxis protein
MAVVGAKDGAPALRLAAELQPRLITIDVMMPNLDGWEVLQRLKTTPETAHIPVVVCSVLHEPELALAMGASDYLTKPVQQADLLAVLERHLGRPTPAT